MSDDSDRFERIAPAGTGGMAQVFRARDRRTGEEVALKVLHPGAVGDAERFLWEAQFLSELHDAAIVRYIEHGRTRGGELYLAMEWLEGEDLGRRLQRGPLEVAETIALGSRVARALAAAHERGIIHRDVKPANVFLPGASIERAKVLDFGIARWASAGPRLTTSGAILGTPSYMSPEQVRGGGQLDARTDVFALGCLLYECLTGAPAFTGASPLAVLSKVLFQEPAPLRAARDDLPEALEKLIADLLAKDPAARPADGAAVAAALARIDHAAPVSGPAAASPNLGEGEQRFLAVILVGGTPERTSMTAMQGLVDGFGGIVEPLIDGSTIVAMSGAQRTAIDRVCQAARCVMAIRRLLPDAATALAMGRADLSEGLGGGEVMERAARLLERAKRGADTRLDDSAASMLEGRFTIRRLEGAIELCGEAADSSTGRTLLGRRAPFVGREREIEIISAWFDECVSAPRARAAIVTAPAGVGKSRLARELDRGAFRGAARIWSARGDPTRAGAPLGLLGPLLRRVMGIRDGESLERRRRALADYLAARLAPEHLEHTTLFLAEVLSSPWSPAERPQLEAARRDPRVLAEHMRRAFTAWLAAECADGPVVIVLDDLHWGDLPTVSFLEVALRELDDRPLFVLALARPELDERFPGLWAKRDALRLRLGGLTKKACERLIAQYLPDAGADDELSNRMLSRASGNAFFLEELIRAVAAGRADALPDTVLAMAAARLERLPAPSRRVIRAASIFGEAFWRGGVAALVGTTEEEVDRRLRDLEAVELVSALSDARFSGEKEYLFRHGLVRDAAYAMLTEDDREVGHRLAGEWLERAGESQASVIAGHFVRGGDAPRACVWNLRAAAQALEAGDFQSVLDCASEAVDLGATSDQRLEARELRGTAFMGLGNWRDAPGELRAALDRVGDDERIDQVRLRLKLAQACFFAFELEEVRVHAEAAIAALEGLDRGDLLAEATAALGVYEEAKGNLSAARAAYTRARQQARGSYFPSEAQLLMALLWLGDVEAAIERGQAFVDQARAMNDVYAYLVALPQVALGLVARGRYASAESLFVEARGAASRHGAGALAARALAMSAGYHQDVLDFAGADALAAEALEMARSASYPPTSVSTRIDLLCSAARAGDPGRAEASLDAVAEAVRKTEGQGWHGWLFKLRFTAAVAEIALSRGDFEAALQAADDVVAQSRACGRAKYQIIGEVVRGQAWLGLGRREPAARALGEAFERAEAIGDPALALRAGRSLLEPAGTDELLARLRVLADGIRRALPESARRAFSDAPGVADLLAG